MTVLEDYQQLPLDGSFHDLIQPVYYRLHEDKILFALSIEAHHCNPAGICHGAVYMAMMDLCMGGAIGMATGKLEVTPTMTMNLNYLTLARVGETLFSQGQVLKLTKAVGFAQGIITATNAEGEDCGEKVIATGTFKLAAKS